jgi:MFS transporter, FHS family, L-fucose permease
MKYKTFPILLAFLCMGVADAMGPMSDAIKDEYGLNNVLSRLAPFFVFIAFAAFSVPGGLLAARIGKKKLLVLGLALNIVAMLIPSLYLPSLTILLGCIFLLGIGTTFLQVAGNPIMRDVSREGEYSRNLSFAQGFKGFGSTISTFMPVIVGAIAFLTFMDWRKVFPVYLLFMIVAFASVLVLQVKETKAEVPPSIASSLGLLKHPVFFFAVVGIFLYVGAEVCMASFSERTLVGFIAPEFKGVKANREKGVLVSLEKTDAEKNSTEKITDPSVLKKFEDVSAYGKTFGPTMFLLMLSVGRIGGGFGLKFLSPRVFFRISALLGILGAAAMMTDSKEAAFVGVVAAGLGFANIWPLLFSITVEEKPECANELSGLMCMAISGGAIVPLIMGQCFDWHFGAMAFIVPAGCFAYLLILSLKSGQKAATT